MRWSRRMEDPMKNSLATVDSTNDIDGWAHETTCPVCGKQNHPVFAHCTYCGVALLPTAPLTVVERADGWLHTSPCPSCRARTDPMFATCEKCGALLPIRLHHVFGNSVPLHLHKCQRCGNLVDPRTGRCRACGKIQMDSTSKDIVGGVWR